MLYPLKTKTIDFRSLCQNLRKGARVHIFPNSHGTFFNRALGGQGEEGGGEKGA